MSAHTERKKAMAHRKGKYVHLEGLHVLNAGIKRCTLTEEEWQRLELVLKYGKSFADYLYPVSRSVYDEDAGVFTDYGKNDQATIWANIWFQKALSMSVQSVEETEEDGIFEVLFLGGFEGVFAQALFASQSPDGPAERIFRAEAEYLWEESYRPESEKEEYISRMAASMRISPKEMKGLSEKILRAPSWGRVKHHLKIEE
jgi:hypothetical protein